jgi:hypothetical protein
VSAQASASATLRSLDSESKTLNLPKIAVMLEDTVIIKSKAEIMIADINAINPAPLLLLNFLL